MSSFIKLFNRKEDNNQANAHLKTSWQECMIGGTWQTIDAASFINLSSAGDFIHRSSWVKLERSFTLPVRAALWKSSNSVYIGVAVCMLWNNFEDPLIIPGRICSISVGERRIPPSKLQNGYIDAFIIISNITKVFISHHVICLMDVLSLPWMSLMLHLHLRLLLAK